ncbi:RNA methyltransferase [Myxococcota bacterium]|nr:RNA methyltransferase [Myxococcota bacterium]MBU1432643.1 RNA methyltransferase [Myxococcota bacterium]MBU1897433.1 RNA methyltransferase [Myxococcota bacterium]
MSHPRDRVLTVYGRKPLLEALQDPTLSIERLLIAKGARGEAMDDILKIARQRGLKIERATPEAVTRISRNGRQDQGVVADISAPKMRPLSALIEAGGPARLLLLDGLTNPANIGLILRAATAAGLEGVIIPRRGSPEVGPLVIKASAGVAFKAPILRVGTAGEAAAALAEAGFILLGLDAAGEHGLFDFEIPPRVAFVMGNETSGITPPVAARLSGALSIPMQGGVESLNVATAATLVCFEVRRRGAMPPSP